MGLWRQQTFWTAHAPEEVEARLRELFPRGSKVTDEAFVVTVEGANRNSWRPRIHGTWLAAGGGTLIEAEYRMHSFVLVFTLLHGIPFLGLSWLIGIGAYLASIPGVERTFVEALDTEHTGEDALAKATGQAVADPDDPGAAAAAPPLLRARTTVDKASFRVGKGRITVDAGGIEWSHAGGREVSWDGLLGFEENLGALAVSIRGEDAFRLPGAPCTPEDVRWLAAFLNARLSRWQTPEADREAAARAKAKLGRLRQ